MSERYVVESQPTIALRGLSPDEQQAGDRFRCVGQYLGRDVTGPLTELQGRRFLSGQPPFITGDPVVIRTVDTRGFTGRGGHMDGHGQGITVHHPMASEVGQIGTVIGYAGWITLDSEPWDVSDYHDSLRVWEHQEGMREEDVIPIHFFYVALQHGRVVEMADFELEQVNRQEAVNALRSLQGLAEDLLHRKAVYCLEDRPHHADSEALRIIARKLGAQLGIEGFSL
jgi:hypothetical protein